MIKKWALLMISSGALSTEAAQAPHAQGYEAFYRKCYDNADSDQVIVSCTAVISRGLVDNGDLAAAYKIVAMPTTTRVNMTKPWRTLIEP